MWRQSIMNTVVHNIDNAEQKVMEEWVVYNWNVEISQILKKGVKQIPRRVSKEDYSKTKFRTRLSTLLSWEKTYPEDKHLSKKHIHVLIFVKESPHC